MTEKENQAIEEQPEPSGNLFEREVETFQRTIQSDGLEKAFQRFGFSLFHSLPAEEQVLYEKEMGILSKEASDHYNLGLAHASREEYEEAIGCWKAALKKKPELADAQFNLAVAYERLDNLTSARKHYQHYRESIEDPEEIAVIDEHLSQL